MALLDLRDPDAPGLASREGPCDDGALGPAAASIAAIVNSDGRFVRHVVGGAVLVGGTEQSVFATASHCLQGTGATHVAVGTQFIRTGDSVAGMLLIRKRGVTGRVARQANGDLSLFSALSRAEGVDPIRLAVRSPLPDDRLAMYVWSEEDKGRAFRLRRKHPVRLPTVNELAAVRASFPGRRERFLGFEAGCPDFVVDDRHSGGAVVAEDGQDSPKLHGVVSNETGTWIGEISEVRPDLAAQGCLNLNASCLAAHQFNLTNLDRWTEIEGALAGRVRDLERRLRELDRRGYFEIR